MTIRNHDAVLRLHAEDVYQISIQSSSHSRAIVIVVYQVLSMGVEMLTTAQRLPERAKRKSHYRI